MKSLHRWKLGIAGVVAVVVSFAMIGSGQAADAQARPATGVGSCTLKNWNPAADPDDAASDRRFVESWCDELLARAWAALATVDRPGK